jgi:hypothetical protein
VEQLLATDAAELDLLLQYPQAIKGQVEEYLGVFREKGGQYLQVPTPVCVFSASDGSLCFAADPRVFCH